MKKFFLKLQSGLPARAMLRRWQAGQSLVEIVLVIGLSAIILPALLTGLVISRQGKAQQAQRTQAIYLLNETVDAVRSVREKGWTGFAVNGVFYPVISGTSWTLTTGSANVNGLTQSVTIGDINRDSSGAIVTLGGSPDPSSKKVDIAISWGQPYLSTVSTTLFITRYLENNSFTQTTVADFNVGIKSGTTVTNTAGGEVTLGAGGHGNWCDPNLSIPSIDLPGNGVANAITAIEGKVFVGTGENASGLSFADVEITNTSPPIPSLGGTFDGYKTNGVFGETNYAYITTDDNSKEVVIIDLNLIVGGKYQEVGSFNSPGNDNGISVFVAGNTGYMTSGRKLYSFDLSSKSGVRSILDSDGIVIGDSNAGYKIVVVGSYAYVAVNAPAYEMQIVDISDPNNLSMVAGVDVDPASLANGEDGLDVYVNPTGTRAYLVTSKFPLIREFFIIDVTTKTNPVIVGSYETNEMDPKGITVVTGNKAIVVGIGGEEYQVIDIANESIPIRCGGLQIDSGINGIYSVIEEDGDAYSYILTRDLNSEFQVIEGGPGGQYSSSGEFISSTFDAGYSTAFNRFDVFVNRPNSTDIKFQVSISQEVSGSCSGASFSFVGPDGTSSSFFTTNQTSGVQLFNYSVPLNLNPGRCFKYKAFLSTIDFSSTPIFYDITVNYSP